MRPLIAIRPFAALVGTTLASGLLLAAVLLGVTPSYGGAIPGEYWIALIAVASIILGWYAARLFPRMIAIPLGAAAAIASFAVVLGVKAIRWPELPLTGGRLQMLVVIFGIAGAIGAAMPRDPARAMASVAWLALAAAVVAIAVLFLDGLAGP